MPEQAIVRHAGFSLNPLSRIANMARAFIRSSLENPQTPLNFPAEWLLDIFNGGRTDSGIRVSEMTALQVSTVFTCVNIISNAVAGLPFNVWEKAVKNGKVIKTKAQDHRLWDIFHSEPNPEMTIFTFLKTFMCHDLLWGNAYAEIARSPIDASITGLWPRNPARTRPVRLTQPMVIQGDLLPRGSLLYETSESLMGNEPISGTDNPEMNWGTRRLVLPEDMIHVPGLSLDGRLGQSTTYLSRQVIGLALATEKYAAKFFGNGARPAGVLTVPGKMEERAIETLRRSWAEAHGGENQHKVAVLESGVTYTKIAATPDEGQMGSTRKYQREEIAAIFNVPLHMVGEADTGRATTEQHSLEFIMYCLKPWIIAIEQEFERKMFPSIGRNAGAYSPKFDTRALIYPDAESRSKYYSSGRQWGILTANDIRQEEDLNPVGPEGDTLMVQANMVNMKSMLLPLAPPTAPTPGAAAPKAPGTGKKPPAPGAAPGLGKVKPSAAKKQAKARQLEYAQRAMEFENPMYVGRHGDTQDDDDGVWSGWDSVPLNDRGKKGIRESAETMKQFGVKRIVYSDIARCAESKEIYRTILGLPEEVCFSDPRARSIDLGNFAKKNEKKYKDQLQKFIDNPDMIIPGSKGLDGDGETVNKYQKRVRESFMDAYMTNDDEGPTLWLTHSSGIAVVENDSADLAAASQVLAPASVARYDGEGDLTVITGTMGKGGDKS